jgi:ParB family chromosome partitioning protein
MSKRPSHRDRIQQTLQRTSRTSVTTEFTSADADLQNVSLESIILRERQPRRQIENVALQNLVKSIKAQGVVQPIVVHQRSDGDLELIAGERRVRAAREAGLVTIPAKVFHNLSEDRVAFIAAMENLQREDLNPVDEVDAILDILTVELDLPKDVVPSTLSRLRKVEHNVMSKSDVPTEMDRILLDKVKEVFSQLSKGTWESFVSNKLGVLRLPKDLLEAVRQGQVEYTKATTLRKVKDEEARRELLAQAGEMGLRELRDEIRTRTATTKDAEYELSRRAGKLTKIELWRDLTPPKRKRAEKLLQQLETLLSQ